MKLLARLTIAGLAVGALSTAAFGCEDDDGAAAGGSGGSAGQSGCEGFFDCYSPCSGWFPGHCVNGSWTCVDPSPGGCGGTGGSAGHGGEIGGFAGSGGAAGAAVGGAGGVPGAGGGAPEGCTHDGATDCSAGPGEEACADLGPMFANEVNAAIDTVIAEHPEYFTDSQYSCCPTALSPDPYVQAVAANVVEAGLCAIQDPNAGDEIGVKRNNACAESYDILTADNLVRRPPGAYTATCWPGWF